MAKMTPEVLQKLTDEYRKTIPNKIQVLRKLTNDARDNLSLENLNLLRFQVHKMAGNAGVYGYMTISNICKEFDNDLIAKAEILKSSEADPKWISHFEEFINKIENEFQQSQDHTISPPQETKKTETKNIIAIVEDDEDLLKILKFSFETEGFEVIGFTKGKDAMSNFSDEKNLNKLSLIILDRMLPDMDGIQILSDQLSKNPNHPPVLILSALSSEQDIMSGLKRGAIDYIAKPFSIPILMEKALTLTEKNKK